MVILLKEGERRKMKRRDSLRVDECPGCGVASSLLALQEPHPRHASRIVRPAVTQLVPPIFADCEKRENQPGSALRVMRWVTSEGFERTDLVLADLILRPQVLVLFIQENRL